MTALVFIALAAAAGADWTVDLQDGSLPFLIVADGDDTLLAGREKTGAFLVLVDGDGEQRYWRRWQGAGEVCAAVFGPKELWISRTRSDSRLCTIVEGLDRETGETLHSFPAVADLDNVLFLRLTRKGILAIGHQRTPPENNHYVPRSPRVHLYGRSGKLLWAMKARRKQGTAQITAAFQHPKHGLILAVSARTPAVSSHMHEVPDFWFGETHVTSQKHLFLLVSRKGKVLTVIDSPGGPTRQGAILDSVLSVCANGMPARLDLLGDPPRMVRADQRRCRSVLVQDQQLIWRDRGNRPVGPAGCAGGWKSLWVSSPSGLRHISVSRGAHTRVSRCSKVQEKASPMAVPSRPAPTPDRPDRPDGRARRMPGPTGR